MLKCPRRDQHGSLLTQDHGGNRAGNLHKLTRHQAFLKRHGSDVYVEVLEFKLLLHESLVTGLI